MIVCVCKAVSGERVARAISDGARSVEEITQCTGAGSGCGSCKKAIQQALDMSSGRLAKPVVRLATLAAVAAS
jgi:bacterioferritin-associated ferredoxin